MYDQGVHNGLEVMPQLIAALTINWWNCTTLIHGLNVFGAH